MVNVLKYEQTNEVNSEVEALFSVIIPILRGVLFSVKKEYINHFGGYNKITLAQLARVYKEGNGDCGIYFEYAVHDTAKGLRLTIVPSKQGKSDSIVIYPMPYDQSFVEIFYQGWYDIKQFLNADAHVPNEIWLPHGDDRFVCKQLEQRRKFPVLEILEVLEVMKQPNLLSTQETTAKIESNMEGTPKIDTIVAPVSFFS